MDQPAVDIPNQLAAFRTTQGRFEKVLLEFGPVLVLLQFNLTGLALILVAAYNRLHPEPQMVTWAVFSITYFGVFLMLLVESVIFRMVLAAIPQTFNRLWKNGSLKRIQRDQEQMRRFSLFLNQFERALNDRRRWLAGAGFALLGLAFFVMSNHIPYVLTTLVAPVDGITKITVLTVNLVTLFLPAVFIGCAIGIAAWKSIVIALFIRKFSRQFPLTVQISHPDRSGGLFPIGELIFFLTSTLIVASLGMSALLIYSQQIHFVVTTFYTRMFLAPVLALSLFVFFWPLLSAHERMLQEKRDHESLLIKITERINDLENSAQTELASMTYKAREEIDLEVKSLSTYYEKITRCPTWPFDRGLLLRFITPQTFSLLSLIGVADPIVSLLRTLGGLISGGGQ